MKILHPEFASILLSVVATTSALLVQPSVDASATEPESEKPPPASAVRESDDATAKYILTPPAPATPRINGARIYGERPGRPFLFTVPATGDRPMRFSAEGLPAGLSIDASTGRITGNVKDAGEFDVKLRATNDKGTDEKPLKVVIGERIALTPPMGWNSWNCWAVSVDAEKVRRAAKAMVDTGLVNHGWTYINIDDAWQGARGGKFNAIQANEKFPDMQALCDEVHAMGLKIGIYSTPWTTSYAQFVGGSANNPEGAWTKPSEGQANREHGKYSFATNDARQWADWGFDYLKYDWYPNDVPHVSEMATALRASGRDIVLSLSNSAPFKQAADWARLANSWRTTGDIRDNWWSVSGIGFSQDRWAPYAGPGHWNDPDMLVVGYVGWGPQLHPSNLTPDEQYTHISLWSLLAAPLLLGNDLERMDPFTLNLLTNDEVLAMNQDPLGSQARRVAQEGPEVTVERPGRNSRPNQARRHMAKQVWARELADGSRAVGLFNLGDEPATVTAKWADIGISGKQSVRDLWRQQDVGTFDEKFETTVPAHGVFLAKISPVIGGAAAVDHDAGR